MKATLEGINRCDGDFKPHSGIGQSLAGCLERPAACGSKFESTVDTDSESVAMKLDDSAALMLWSDPAGLN